MTLSEELTWRGFINQTTFKDLKVLDKTKFTFYHGFDASADSQTVGNLAAMMFDMVFIRHGYKAIIVAGGATSLVGDPGGKDEERKLQGEKVIAHNVERAKAQVTKVFGTQPFTLVNNLDWTKGMSVIDFLRDIGKNFSVTPLIQRDYIAKRLGEDGVGISYTEFSYSLLQAMDYLHLYDKYGCTLQLGGSDQWSNCLSGVELIRKTRHEETHVITQPLVINKATGKKFGKSEDGAIWLDETKTSVFKFYQFWLNADDEGVETYLKIYTAMDKTEIDKVIDDFRRSPNERLAQKTLADEVTKIVHGPGRAVAIKKVTETVFESGDYLKLSAQDFKLLEFELPVIEAKVGKTTLIEALVNGKLAGSNSEARRFLADNAVYINGKQVPSENTVFNKGDAIESYAVLRRGKNSLALVKLS